MLTRLPYLAQAPRLPRRRCCLTAHRTILKQNADGTKYGFKYVESFCHKI